jgi:hypothetical protein
MTYPAHAPIAAWTLNVRSQWLAMKLSLAPSLKLGLAPYASRRALSSAKPRPDLAGHRLRRPGGRTVYLVDPVGHRRRTPDHLAYARLFRDGSRITDYWGLEAIVQGPSFAANTMLVRGHASETLYLLDRGRKRRIAGVATLHKYSLEPDRVFVVRQPLIDAMPCGTDWE